MMRNGYVFFVFLCGLLTTAASFAQPMFTLTGSLRSDEGETVPFAAVGLFLAKDSSLVRSTVSDDTGGFTIKSLASGGYYATVNSVGLQPFRSAAFTITDQDLVLEAFVLRNQTAVLEEVEIIGEKPLIEIQADKTVLNVQDNIAAAGTSGFELLRKAPGVVIDNNDNLIVEGKSGVQIFIDGKPSVLQGEDLTAFLQTLQADDIEAIEVITQPSSRYDAAGTAGIINIKLKRDKNLGTNGTVGAGYAYGKNSRYNTSLSLNHRSKKMNLFGTYSNRLGKSENFTNFDRRQFGTIFDSRTVSVNDRQNHNLRTGADWLMSQRSTLGVLLTANINDTETDSDTRSPIRPIGTTVNQEVLLAESNTIADLQNLNGNLNYRYQNPNGRSFNVDLDYGTYRSDRDNFQPNYYYDGTETILKSQILTRMVTLTDIDIMSAKADYEQNLWGGKIAVGGKSVRIETDNVFDFFDLDAEGGQVRNIDRSNRFVYQETVHAGYVNYNRKWKKISVQAGLRIEQTQSDGRLFSDKSTDNERVQRTYTDLFPSGGITYQPSRKHNLALTYSRRIERPNYQSLNPFEFQINELSFRRGNPFLQPQYTDNLKLSHSFNYSINTSISYSFVRDFSAQITEPQDERRSFIQAQNIANQRVWAASVSMPLQPAEWWSAYVSLTGSHSSFEVRDERFLPITQASFNLYGQNTFKLPEDIRFEVSGWFNSPSVWGGTYITSSQGALTLALQKKFMEERLSTSIALDDVFFTAPWKGETRYTDIEITGNGGWESRQVRINVSYRFGNEAVKSARRRNTGIEDEQRRSND